MENSYQTPYKKSVKLWFNGMEEIAITEVRARVISQEKGLYKILYEWKENWAEVSGKYRYETTTVSDFPAVGDYVVLKPDFLSRHLQIILKKNNLKHIRYHDLRHSCASLLIANGVSLKEIQVWLGHSGYGTTANIYSHLEYSAKVNSANKIAEKLKLK